MTTIVQCTNPECPQHLVPCECADVFVDLARDGGVTCGTCGEPVTVVDTTT